MTLTYLTRPYAPPLPEAYKGERARLYPLIDVDSGVRVEIAGHWRLGTLKTLHGDTALVVVSGERKKVKGSESRAHPNGWPIQREFKPEEVREA